MRFLYRKQPAIEVKKGKLNGCPGRAEYPLCFLSAVLCYRTLHFRKNSIRAFRSFAAAIRILLRVKSLRLSGFRVFRVFRGLNSPASIWLRLCRAVSPRLRVNLFFPWLLRPTIPILNSPELRECSWRQDHPENAEKPSQSNREPPFDIQACPPAHPRLPRPIRIPASVRHLRWSAAIGR